MKESEYFFLLGLVSIGKRNALDNERLASLWVEAIGESYEDQFYNVIFDENNDVKKSLDEVMKEINEDILEKEKLR